MTHSRFRPVLRRGLILMLWLAALAAAGWLLAMAGRRESLPQVNLLAADKGYGVTVDLTQTGDAALESTLDALAENGLFWLRLPVRWRDVEPAPGRFDWAAPDRVLAAIERRNALAGGGTARFKVIAVLVGAPAWARAAGSPESAPPQNLPDFGRFARALAGRYAAQLDDYQIWHEPNLSAGWGNAFVDPPAYARLLREAALNIRAADPTAHILTAALAPTREAGPLNLNEMAFLAELYRANAAEYFDIVAGQPYGFDFAAEDPPNPDRLNFRRLELLRQVMLDHGDAATPIWATAAGWNALPPDWDGQPNPWRDDQSRSDSPDVQVQRTAAGLAFARQHWPWLGPLLAVRWDSADLSAGDPARGFSLLETPLIGPFKAAAAAPAVATVGRYPANHPSGQTGPGWRSALWLADVPRQSPRTLVIDFEGSRLDLAVNRGEYRGYLWVTVDGGPANALPQDGGGRSYVVLFDPLRAPDTVMLARGLPPGRHRAVIEADGGWEQWPVAGWTVSNAGTEPVSPLLAGLVAVILVAGGAALLWQFRRGLSRVAGRLRRYIPGEGAQTALVFGLATTFYFAPDGAALALVLPLAAAILYRPDLGLALIAFSLSFFQAPRQLPGGGVVWLTETPLLLAALGAAIRWWNLPRPRPFLRLNSLDWAALALAALGLVSTLAAPYFGVNMHAWRIVILGSVLYYFLVRFGLDFGPNAAQFPRRWVWRLVDALAAGAALHAALVLWGYAANHQFVTVDGVHRAMSPVYASPNNLALFLGRVLPLLLAVALLPGARGARRGWYGAGVVVVGAALLLTASRGALLIGLPAGLAVMAALVGLRFGRGRGWWAAVGALLLASVLLLALGASARLDGGNSAFFRLKLWQSSLNMLADFWALGIGPGSFLYLYRTRYMLPDAWADPNLSHPHNIFLDFAVRLGPGGLLLLGWLQLAFWRQAWRLYRRWPSPLVLGLMGSMAVFLAHGLVDNSYFLVDLAFIFFLTVGLVQGITRRGAESNPD